MLHLPSRYFTAALQTVLTGGVALLFCHAGYAATTPLTKRQCTTMQKSKVFAADNPVKCARLMQVTFRYVDFKGQEHDDGKVVVLDAVAPQVQGIFDDLFAQRFPLQQAALMERYKGDDEASMKDNNSSAFNGRPMTGGGAWSKHAYGVAIDINPLQNPYLSKNAARQLSVLPPAANPDYVSRRQRPGMAEEVLDIFFRHGFLVWGGHWKQPIDYQHFEIGSRDFIKRLLQLPTSDAQAEFSAYAEGYSACLKRADVADLAGPTIRQKACAGQSKR